MDPSERFMAASIAANTRWANEPNRTAATSAARAAFDRRFEDQVDPDRSLTTAERARRTENARKAYFMQLALASAKARRARAVDAEGEANDVA